MISNLFKSFVFVLPIIFLTACGGGGGGGESSTSTPNPAPSPSPTPTPSSYDAYSVVSAPTEMRFVYMTKRQGFEGYNDDHYCIINYKMTLEPVNANSLFVSNLVAEQGFLIIQTEDWESFGLYTVGIENKQITLTSTSLSAENSLDINTSSSNPDDLDFTETTGELTLYIEDDLNTNNTPDNAYGCLKDLEMNVHALNGVIIGGNSVLNNNNLDKNAGVFGYPYQLFDQTNANNPFLKSDLIGEYDHIEYEFRYYSQPNLVTNQYIPGVEIAQQTKQYIDGFQDGQYEYLRTFFSDDGGVYAEGGAAQVFQDSYYIGRDSYYDNEHTMGYIVIMSPDKDGLITYDPRLSWVGIMAAP